AQIGSAALARTVRRRGEQLVAATCHEDVLDWLDPDWIYEPAHDRFTRRRLRRSEATRPRIALDVAAVSATAWEAFRPHHYLSGALNGSARCFAAFWNARPVAFVAVLHQPHPRIANLKREHRLVCLPEFQGIGLGVALSEYVAGVCTTLGFEYASTTSHPGLIAARSRSPNWRRTGSSRLQKPGQDTLVARGGGNWRLKQARLTSRFIYCGSPVEMATAAALWEAAHPSYRESPSAFEREDSSCR
ncbi:MAG TPA: GNAT family N-acetyltransferase, partial [Pirellulales bacterium]